jgi:hypothetical protein
MLRKSGLMLVKIAIATAVLTLILVGCNPKPQSIRTAGNVGREAAEKAARNVAETFANTAKKTIATERDEETIEDVAMRLLKKAAAEEAKARGKDCWNELEDPDTMIEDCWNGLQGQEREEALQPVQEAAEADYTQRLLEHLEDAQREAALERAIATLEQEGVNIGSTAPSTANTTPVTYANRQVSGTIYTYGEVPVQYDKLTVKLSWEDSSGNEQYDLQEITDDTEQYVWHTVGTDRTYRVCAGMDTVSGHYWSGCGLSFYLSPYVSSPVPVDVILVPSP